MKRNEFIQRAVISLMCSGDDISHVLEDAEQLADMLVVNEIYFDS